MIILKITRYPIKSPQLAPWVKFIWRLESANADMHYKLLPTDCIDVILNLGSEIVYETEGTKIIAPPFHINGLRSKYSFIHQKSCVHTFGISFYSYGFFPFTSKPMTALHNRITDLCEVASSLSAGLKKAVSSNQVRCEIERLLLQNLSLKEDSLERSQLLANFLQSSLTVSQFCEERFINIKTF